MNSIQQNRKWWILSGVGISSMIVAIDFTIVVTALATIQNELKLDISQLQWIIAGYGITFATLLTVMGRLGDILGRRLILYCGMIGFLLTSIGAGLSFEIWQLILFRFLQGIFAASIFPCGMAITSEAFPKQEHGKALGIYGSFLGIGLGLGPILGGVIVATLSWRWIFFINIPIVFISFLICIPNVLESKAKEKETIDWWGMILFVLGFGTIIFAITEGPTYGWSNPLIYGSLIFGAVLLALFVYVEEKVRMPILPFHTLKNRGFFLGLISYIVSISFVWPLLFLLPLYLQNVLGLEPGLAGLTLFAMTGMTIIAPVIIGKFYDRKGAFPSVLLLFACIFVGYILQMFFTIEGPIWLILLAFIIFGFGWGAGNGLGMPLALSRLPSTEQAGVVSGAVITLLNAMGVLALTVIGMIFRYGERNKLNTELANSGLQLTESQIYLVRSTLSDPSRAESLLGKVSDQVLGFFKSAFLAGFEYSIWTLFLVSILLFFLILKPLMKERKLSRKG